MDPALIILGFCARGRAGTAQPTDLPCRPPSASQHGCPHVSPTLCSFTDQAPPCASLLPHSCLTLAFLCTSILVPAGALAQDSAPAKLIVGTKEAAPFSFKGEDGTWQGMSIDLWRSIASELELEFEFQEASLKELVTGLTDGRFDASVAALTVTPAREKIVDFSHAFHPSGLGIAVRKDERATGLLAVFQNLFTIQFLEAIGTLIVVLFLGGAVVWFLEHKRNPEQFGGSTADGLGSAF